MFYRCTVIVVVYKCMALIMISVSVCVCVTTCANDYIFSVNRSCLSCCRMWLWMLIALSCAFRLHQQLSVEYSRSSPWQLWSWAVFCSTWPIRSHWPIEWHCPGV